VTDSGKKRRMPFVVAAIAIIAMMVGWWFTRSEETPTVRAQPALSATRFAPGASATNAEPAPDLSRFRPAPAPEPPTAPVVDAVPVAVTAPNAAMATPSPQAISVVIDAPLQALHGTTFDVTVSASHSDAIQLAKFVLAYDTDALEVLDGIDANGTTLPIMPSGEGTVELDFDRALGAARWPSVRFLVRVTEPRAVLFTVVAQLHDAAGNQLPTAASSPASMTLWP
jgi:hypothetical protein